MRLSLLYQFIPQLFIAIIIILILLIFTLIKQHNELKQMENEYVPKRDFKEYCDSVTEKVSEVVDENFDNAKSNIARMFNNQPQSLSEDEIENIVKQEVKKRTKKLSNITEEDVMNIVTSQLEVYTDTVINEAFSDVITNDDLNEELCNYVNIDDHNENINIIKNSFQKIKDELLKLNDSLHEAESEIYGDENEYSINERINEVELKFQNLAKDVYKALGYLKPNE